MKHKNRKVDRLLAEYSCSHRNKTNKIIHYVMVPAIFFSIIGILYAVPLPSWIIYEKSPFVSFAFLAMLLSLVYYFTLSRYLFLGFVFWALICIYGNHWIYLLVGKCDYRLFLTSFTIFLVAWIFQFVGHKIEGKKPSFLKDIQFLLIGPAWIMKDIYNYMGVRY